MLRGKLRNEARWNRRCPLAVYPAVCCVHDPRLTPRPRDRDIGEAALLLQAGVPAFVERALRGKDAFLPSREEHGVELKTFGRMDGEGRHLRRAVVGVIVHHRSEEHTSELQSLI